MSYYIILCHIITNDVLTCEFKTHISEADLFSHFPVVIAL